MDQLESQRGGHGLASLVIASRAKPASGEDQTGLGPGTRDLRSDRACFVANDRGPGHADAAAGKLLAEPD